MTETPALTRTARPRIQPDRVAGPAAQTVRASAEWLACVSPPTPPPGPDRSWPAAPPDPAAAIRVVHDLGSGTGGMPRWLAPLSPRPQHWVLHDRDADLLASWRRPRPADRRPPPRHRRDPPRRCHPSQPRGPRRRRPHHRLRSSRHAHGARNRASRRDLCRCRRPDPCRPLRRRTRRPRHPTRSTAPPRRRLQRPSAPHHRRRPLLGPDAAPVAIRLGERRLAGHRSSHTLAPRLHAAGPDPRVAGRLDPVRPSNGDRTWGRRARHTAHDDVPNSPPAASRATIHHVDLPRHLHASGMPHG